MDAIEVVAGAVILALGGTLVSLWNALRVERADHAETMASERDLARQRDRLETELVACQYAKAAASNDATEYKTEVAMLRGQLIALQHAADPERMRELIGQVGDLLVDVLHGRPSDQRGVDMDDDGDGFGVVDEPEVAFDLSGLDDLDDYPELDAPEEIDP